VVHVGELLFLLLFYCTVKCETSPPSAQGLVDASAVLKHAVPNTPVCLSKGAPVSIRRPSRQCCQRWCFM